MLSYTYILGELFYDDDEKLGLIYLEKIEPFAQNEEYLEDENLTRPLALAYGQVAAYYFREREIESAIKWINKALELDPNSSSLKRKQEYIKNNADYYKNSPPREFKQNY